jgi:hypothetical protein
MSCAGFEGFLHAEGKRAGGAFSKNPGLE